MKNHLSVSTILALIFSTPVFAGSQIVGPKMDASDLPPQTCLLVSTDKILSEQEEAFFLEGSFPSIKNITYSTCSSTLISHKHLLTAKHCVDTASITISHCVDRKNKHAYLRRIIKKSLPTHTADLAVLELDREVNLEPMAIIDETQFLKLIRPDNKNPHRCAHFGYGRNEEGLELSLSGTIHNQIIMDFQDYYDSLGIMDRGYKYARSFDAYRTFSKLQDTDPLTYVTKALALPDAVFYIRSDGAQISTKDLGVIKLYERNKEQERVKISPIQSGDSGGTFACESDNHKWVLLGVHNKVAVSPSGNFGETGYSTPILRQHRKFVVDTLQLAGQSLFSSVLFETTTDAKIRRDMEQMRKGLEQDMVPEDHTRFVVRPILLIKK